MKKIVAVLRCDVVQKVNKARSMQKQCRDLSSRWVFTVCLLCEIRLSHLPHNRSTPYELRRGWYECWAEILPFCSSVITVPASSRFNNLLQLLGGTLRTWSSCGETQSMSNNFLVLVPLVPGFSTASYLKVHIKTHHGSPLPPSSTMHTYPEPRGELQMHNGNPYHMGRQCSVEGKQPRPRHSQLPCVWLFNLLRCFFWWHMLLHPVVCLTHEHTSPSATMQLSATASVCCLLRLTGCLLTLEEAAYANLFFFLFFLIIL